MNAKHLVITETDFDRLKGLCHSRQGRICYGVLAGNLEQELGRSEVVAATRIPKGVVTMNSRVRIRDTKSNKTEIFTLVYPQQANVNNGRLSVLAPLGMALLGAKVGDPLEVSVPAGVRKIKIDRILYQPEAAGDFHL